MRLVIIPVIGLWLLAAALWLAERTTAARVDVDLILGDSEPLEAAKATVTTLAPQAASALADLHPGRVTESV